MALFRKAERSKAKLRLGLSGVSGSGKTYSSLLVASGIVPWEKIALIDTENRSGDLYAHLGPYSVCQILSPFTVQKYIEAIHEAEQSGFELIIIDSLSHAWSGEGGLLDQQSMATNNARNKGNSYTAWREITPMHNKLVEVMLQSPCHIIATTRSKQAYEQQEENGRKKVVKLGLAPIQREGMEYEFTSFLDVSLEHVASSSKDRTGIFDGKSVLLGAQTGKELLAWLETGSDNAPPIPVFSPAQPEWVTPQAPIPQQELPFEPAPPFPPAPEPAAPQFGFPALEQEIINIWGGAGWSLDTLVGWATQRFGGRGPSQITPAECQLIISEISAHIKAAGGQA